MQGATQHARREAAIDEFVPIALASLGAVEHLELDLYLFDEAQGGPVLYRGHDVELTPDDVATLAARGVRSLFIQAAELEQYQTLLSTSAERTLSDEELPVECRFAILQDTAAPLLSAALRRLHVDEVVTTARQIGTQMSGLLSNSQAAPGRVVELLRHDYYTYTHMVNVATYATLLAIELGIRDSDELTSVTTGAMLHDIGKRRVPAELLRKTSPLTPAEEHTVRKHTIAGFEDLRAGGECDWGALMMVYQHHERHDGTGYPVGLDRHEIHPQASICMIADVFDAMTCTRPYRQRLSASTAAAHLQRSAGTQFDPDMVDCWLNALRKTS